MRIAIDAMGGDFAPAEIVQGALDGLRFIADSDQLVLFGREDAIRQHLAAAHNSSKQIVVHHCSEVIEMDDSPVEALRQKKNSSIVVMNKMAKERQVDAIISAGNTGACAAAGQIILGPMPNVQRPGIAVVLPSFHGPLTVCDVGANVNPKPQHLVEYDLMASIFSETILGIKAPRVALLSIGGEEVKGNPLTKQVHEMLKQGPNINFVGNVEGRDMFAGGCEVAICDGFVGNVVLKLTEGLADGLFKTIQHEIEVESPDLASRFDPIVKKIWARHDYSEYGGAPLLGLNGVSMICHGSSDRRAIMNAVRVCADFVRRDLNRIMQARLSEVADHA